MYSLYEQQFDECHALYEQGKFAECVKLGEYNLTDPGAADEWRKAERYRVTAENAYHFVRDKVEARKATLKPDDPSLTEDIEGLKDLRTNLDNLCKYQAKYAPEDYSLEGACYPPREGRVKDLVLWRKTGQGWQSSDDEDKDQEDQMEDVVGTRREDELEDMLGKAAKIEQDKDDIVLKVQAAGDNVFGKNLNTTDTMKEVVLDKRRKEGASVEATKSSKDAAAREGKAQDLPLHARDQVVRGDPKTDGKGSVQSLGRQLNNMSLAHRPKPTWRGV